MPEKAGDLDEGSPGCWRADYVKLRRCELRTHVSIVSFMEHLALYAAELLILYRSSDRYHWNHPGEAASFLLSAPHLFLVSSLRPILS